MADCQTGHQLAGSGRDRVGEGIAGLECQHCGLPGDAQYIRQRCHKRHGDGGLAGAGGNQEIQEITGRLIQRYIDDVSGSVDWHESLLIDYDVMTDTDKWFTLRLSLYEGAGSSMQYYKFYTLNKETGELCTLADLFKDDLYIKRISEEIRRQMEARMEEDPTCTYWVDNEIEDWNFEAVAPDQHFYLNAAGNLVLVFDKYTVAPGYMGTPEFEIQKEIFADILK